MSQFQAAYQQFFESPAGLEFVKTLTDIIDNQHQKAENEPERASAYTQRAKGIREALQVIQSVTAERNPQKNKSPVA